MNLDFVLYLLTMAVVTYAVRMVPMVLVKKEIKNEFILSFLNYIPYTVLAVMTIPAVFFATSSVISAVVGVIVAVILAYFDRGLLIVSFSACAAVFITELILTYFF